MSCDVPDDVTVGREQAGRVDGETLAAARVCVRDFLGL